MKPLDKAPAKEKKEPAEPRIEAGAGARINRPKEPPMPITGALIERPPKAPAKEPEKEKE